jgi:cystathionine beta-lyase
MTKNKDTLLAEAARADEFTFGVVNPPVFHASTVIFKNYADMRDRIMHMDDTTFYGRMGTPTTRALEEAMATFEGGEGARLFPSGIAALSVSFLTVLGSGDHILLPDTAYEPVRGIANSLLKRMGIKYSYYAPDVGAEIADEFKPNTKAILVESPGSLTFEVQDTPLIAGIAHELGAYVIADNTWATPYFFNALEAGADMSVHAGTKYIVGHSDVMIGIVVANKKAYPRLRKTRMSLGQTVGPDDAYLTLRGLRTLGVRLRQHEKNALKVAGWLQEQTLVDKVLHPAFPSCPGHDLWKRDFKGSTGLFSIVLKDGKLEDIGQMVDDMKHFKLGLSWGGFESLIYPADPKRVRTIQKWAANGPLLRLHVGLEDPDDLIEDLRLGLKRFQDHLGVK